MLNFLQLDEFVVIFGFVYNIVRYFFLGIQVDKERCVEFMEKIGVLLDLVMWYLRGVKFLE